MKTKPLILLTTALCVLATLSTTYAAGKGKGGGGGNGGGGGDPGGGDPVVVGPILFGDAYTVVKKIKGRSTDIYKRQIFAMNPDGTDVVQLTIDTTNEHTYDRNPRWSPDKEHILFSRTGGLYIMDAIGEANGGESFPVVSEAATVGSDWSPDGNFICYPWYGEGLGVVEVDPATGWVGEPSLIWEGWAGFPSWSPDGSKIVFDGSHPDPNDPSTSHNYLTILDLNTGEETVWFDYYSADIPQWSPDGSQIAFSAYTVETVTTGGETTDIYYYAIFTIDPDFTAYARVTNSETPNARLAAWSPDGTEMVFMSDGLIYKITLSTGETTVLGSGGNGIDWAP